MSFNQEAQNIRNYLTQDKMGNAYNMADVVLNKLPKTAEHHMVFTNHFLKNNATMDAKSKEKLTSYIMDKIEKELERTKVPISMLKGLHYLSITGVDRKKKCLLTMNSQHSGKHLNDYTEVPIADLLRLEKFELIYPEHLDNENLDYLTGKFGLKKDLYNEDGSMNMDEQIQKNKEAFKQQPQNMLHVNGVEFDLDTKNYDYEFENNFVNEQIYMPNNLDLPKTLKKKK